MSTIDLAEWSIDLPLAGNSTTQSEEGRPDLHRFFQGPVIVAVSESTVETEATLSVAEGVHSLVVAYQMEPGFDRHPVAAPNVSGARAMAGVSFVWDDDAGDKQISQAVVAATETSVVVVHASYPAILAEDGASVADEICSSIRVRRVDVNPSAT